MNVPRILAFGGSLRQDSYNQKLAAIAAEGAREAGAEVTLISLRDFPMPLFDQDLEAEQGMPAEAKRLKELFLSHQGLLIASPEYNSGYSAALKNAIDWVSRSETSDEPALSTLAGKSAVLMATSPGGLGGLRGRREARPRRGPEAHGQERCRGRPDPQEDAPTKRVSEWSICQMSIMTTTT